MRCPHCAGENPVDAAFCGICGNRVTAGESHSPPQVGGSLAAAGYGGQSGGGQSMSFFELPVSRGARLARVSAVVALNLVLIGAGVAMIASYFRDRAAVLERFRGGGDSAQAAVEVEIESPSELPAEPTESGDSRAVGTPSKGARKGAAEDGAPRASSAKPAEASKKRKAASRPPPSSQEGSTTKSTDAPGAGAPPADDGTLGTDPRDEDVVADQPTPEETIRAVSARVGRVVDRHRVQLQKCYQQASKTEAPGDPLSGRVEVRFTIMPNGTASDVSVPVNTSGSDRLADCVAKSVGGWALPNPGDEPLVLQWPFVFTAPR